MVKPYFHFHIFLVVIYNQVQYWKKHNQQTERGCVKEGLGQDGEMDRKWVETSEEAGQGSGRRSERALPPWAAAALIGDSAAKPGIPAKGEAIIPGAPWSQG